MSELAQKKYILYNFAQQTKCLIKLAQQGYRIQHYCLINLAQQGYRIQHYIAKYISNDKVTLTLLNIDIVCTTLQNKEFIQFCTAKKI